MAVDDAAPASVVLHPAEHAPIGVRARPGGGPYRSSLEGRSVIADRLPITADARAAPRPGGEWQRDRGARQSVRCHARRAAKPLITGRALSLVGAGTFIHGAGFAFGS